MECDLPNFSSGLVRSSGFVSFWQYKKLILHCAVTSKFSYAIGVKFDSTAGF
jgi:hypothetical protein